MSCDILVVHKDVAVSRRLREAFRSIQARVAWYASGKEGVRSYKRARFDALITAPQLADIDAWRLVRMIRTGHFGFPGIPIVVVCEPHERALYEPLRDQDTHVVALDGTPAAFAHDIVELIKTRPRHSLLLVEDDPSAAAAAVRALEKYFHVDLAEDGPSALTAWFSRRHELIVLDLMLPGLSGEEVLTWGLAANPHQPILILTALDDPQRCEELMLNGATDFIGKGTNLTEFATHCLRVLQQSKYVDAVQSAIESHDKLDVVSQSVRAADLSLARGQTREATHHLKHALAAGSVDDISDDTWARVLRFIPPGPAPNS